MVRREAPVSKDVPEGVVEDTYRALMALGHAEADARKLIEQTLASGTKFKDVESLIQAIYKKQFG